MKVTGTGTGTVPGPSGRVTLVLGTSAGGTGAHVLMLAAGLAERGIAVSVAGPSVVGARLFVPSVPGVTFSAVEIGERPRVGDLAVILRLRGLLLRPVRNGPDSAAGGARGRPPGGSPGDAPGGIALAGDVVHAHGLRAGALAVLALALVRGRRRPRVVVTVHNAPPPGGGAAGLVYRLLERVVATGADLVLCVSPDLERRMWAAGARRVGRAVVAAPAASADPGPGLGGPADAGLGLAVLAGSEQPGRPVVLAAGRLAAQKGFDVLLEAAACWRDLEPAPLMVIAGDGPLAGQLRDRAAALGVAAVFPGHRGDVSALLADAAVFVLPSRWEGQPLVLQEALRAGTPVVATRVGGIPGLTGEDAALLVPPGDPRALGGAVRAVLTDPSLAARLRAAARVRAAALPGADDAVAAVLACYAALTRTA